MPPTDDTIGKVSIGTAGWSYPDWEGFVYPKGFTGDRLTYLAQFVNVVEINTTFYRPAESRVSEMWAKKVSPFKGFFFTAKLAQSFTHERGAVNQLEARKFIDGIEPLREAGLLKAILMQFPWSFRYGEENLLHIERLKDVFGRTKLAVEVRHASWDRPEFGAFLTERGMTFVNLDQPKARDSIRQSAHVTSDLAYVRMHGRNEKDWFRYDAGRDERYNYLYKPQELTPWLDKIKAMEAKAESVVVVMNNHYKGQALANALELKHLYHGRKINMPEQLFEGYPILTSMANNPPAQFELFS